jgi:hypothetical protein
VGYPWSKAESKQARKALSYHLLAAAAAAAAAAAKRRRRKRKQSSMAGSSFFQQQENGPHRVRAITHFWQAFSWGVLKESISPQLHQLELPIPDSIFECIHVAPYHQKTAAAKGSLGQTSSFIERLVGFQCPKGGGKKTTRLLGNCGQMRQKNTAVLLSKLWSRFRVYVIIKHR